MLERWQQESTLDQPYHNIEGVKIRADMGDSKEISNCTKASSSVGFYDPKDITK